MSGVEWVGGIAAGGVGLLLYLLGRVTMSRTSAQTFDMTLHWDDQLDDAAVRWAEPIVRRCPAFQNLDVLIVWSEDSRSDLVFDPCDGAFGQACSGRSAFVDRPGRCCVVFLPWPNRNRGAAVERLRLDGYGSQLRGMQQGLSRLACLGYVDPRKSAVVIFEDD
eukprot:TRINITY_DN7428_c0_g1_i1.p1 TRINITY_DN7428_c0_g1~~TRINITY_DN7428_c0_g1_i1.p1  ORF type:complete len:164 (+),score=6.02 TRINITY_DN7428_c0_g1_i1:103-594(+)